MKLLLKMPKGFGNVSRGAMELHGCSRSLIAVILVALACSEQLNAQGEQPSSHFYAGEVLQYKVKWSFLRLGTVVIRQQPHPADPDRFILKMNVKSSQGLPFISLNFVNESVLSRFAPSLSHEVIFSGEDPSIRTVYQFDSKSGSIVMEDSAQGRRVRRDSVTLGHACYDALGLLMLTRQLSKSGKTVTLPTLTDYQIADTRIIFTEELEELEVDALPVGVRSRRFEGRAEWEGKSFAGMTGSFQGWISDDEAALPLRAEVKIFLGSIVLELESFERPRSEDGEVAHRPSGEVKGEFQ